MKKSTLITTIAMVVVVVVALSTATYAWFTSSSTSTAHDQITVTSEAGWAIMGANSVVTTDDDDAVEYNAATPIAMTMLNGLFSPTAPIAATFGADDYEYSVDFTNLPLWYDATQKGSGKVGTATITDTTKIDPKTTDTQTSPVNYIRCESTFGTAKSLTVTITVVINDTATNVQLAAAQELCTYIVYYKQTAEDAGTKYTAYTDYDYGSVTGSTASKATRVNAFDVTGTTGTNTTIAGDREWVLASSTAIDTKYTGASEAISTGKKYYQLSLLVGNVDPGMGVNFAIMTWFNGWRIDSTANGTVADIYLAFGETPAAPAQP